MPNTTTFGRVTPADLPTCTQFIYNFNVIQPTNHFLFRNWPNESFQLSYYHEGMIGDFSDPDTEMWKLAETDELGIPQEIIGIIILNRKKGKMRLPEDKVEEERRLVNETPKEINVDFRRVMRRTLRDIGKDITAVEHFGTFPSSVFSCQSSD